MESYIKQIQSIDFAPIIQRTFSTIYDPNLVVSDTSKRKREDYGIEDIRIRVENLLGLANDFVKRDKSKINPEETKSYCEAPRPSVQQSPSRIPRRSNSIQDAQKSDAKSRSVTPQRLVQSRIQYFEALSQDKAIYKTILSQERELGIERTCIPIAVNIKTSQKGPGGAIFNQVTPTTVDKSVFVFAAPIPVRSIPRLVTSRKNVSGSCQIVTRNMPFRNYNPDTPSKIPLLDKSKFFAGESSRMLINRKTG